MHTGIAHGAGVLKQLGASQARCSPSTPVSRSCQIILTVCESRRTDERERRPETPSRYELALVRNSRREKLTTGADGAEVGVGEGCGEHRFHDPRCG